MIRVLIAEDNPVNRELLRELLQSSGCEVLEACNGQQALQMLEEVEPDIVLLDLGMPVLDGVATIARIRQDPRFAKLPVVAVTAYAMQGDRERTLDAGFDAYVTKPIQAKVLYEELEHARKRRIPAKSAAHSG